MHWTLIEEHADSGVTLWANGTQWAVCPCYGCPEDADSFVCGGFRDGEAEERARLEMVRAVSAEYAAARAEA